VPVQLTEEALRDALAVLEERDPDAARGAGAALESLGWEREGPLLLRRYDVQLFLWYQLPRKWLVSLEGKRSLAQALASLLDRLGGVAATYAEVCRSPDTDELLRMWEREDPGAWRRLRELLERSGLEPPDTELLVWGSMMGLVEARVRELVALALEEAVEDRRLSPGSPGSRRRRAEVADAVLGETWEDDETLTRLAAVHAERVERWLHFGHTRGGMERRAIVERAADTVSHEQPTIEPALARQALAPALWLLGRARNGIGLTQTGALNRAFVRETVDRWTGWWDAELFGPPNREDEVALLHELHALLRRTRLVRRERGRIVATKRGREQCDDPPALLAALATELLAGKSFDAACAELATALALDGAAVDATLLATAVHPALVAEGWSSGGDPPSERDVAWTIAAFMRAAEAVGLLARVPGESRRSRAQLVLTPAGRAGLAAGLRARALAPAAAP
jgi:hypothetical protein